METEARTQSERRATTRRSLLDATIDLLMEKGLSACSLAAVARKAGMTTGAVQHHFQTKAQLMRAVIAERLFAPDTVFDWSALDDASIETRCAHIIEHQWRFYKNPKYLAIWDIILGARARNDIQAEIKEWQRAGIRTLEAGIARIFEDQQLDAADIEAVQFFLNAHLRGLSLLRTVQDEPKIIDAQLNMLGHLLRDYIVHKSRG